MSPEAGDPTTLPGALSYAAEHFPHRGVALFDGRGRPLARRTYLELSAIARRGAGRLHAQGVAAGDRVVVCLPTCWEWMESFLGAMLLGARPVALAPSGALGASEAHTQKVVGVVERLGARLLVTGAAVAQEVERVGGREVAGLVRSPEDLAAVVANPEPPLGTPEPGDVAFLQLTSGSTGVARAVRVTHRAVVHNNRASGAAIGAPRGASVEEWAESMVAWLPLHHDMGLVGCLFMSIVHGLDLWLLNPAAFLAKPHLWLEHLGRHGTTFAPAPNFGFQLCAERLGREGFEGLDLAPFQAAMVGAEMVRPETLETFIGLTAGTGFSPRALRPCYGLAEATLAVTFDTRGEGVRTRPNPSTEGMGEVVCLGFPVADTELRITAPDGQVLPEGEVGEVLVRGPGIFDGYESDPEATAEGLRDGWLATGDLGFLHRGELYLTGRLKDILILRGQNLMPHELEWLAERATGGGGLTRTGAFSVDAGSEGEKAVVVTETTERSPEALAELARRIRLEVGHALSLTLADVVFVRRGKIPKTTSGKVQRRELRRKYLAGELERL